jgi:hypothetical protein
LPQRAIQSFECENPERAKRGFGIFCVEKTGARVFCFLERLLPIRSLTLVNNQPISCIAHPVSWHCICVVQGKEAQRLEIDIYGGTPSN